MSLDLFTNSWPSTLLIQSSTEARIEVIKLQPRHKNCSCLQTKSKSCIFTKITFDVHGYSQVTAHQCEYHSNHLLKEHLFHNAEKQANSNNCKVENHDSAMNRVEGDVVLHRLVLPAVEVGGYEADRKAMSSISHKIFFS